MQLPGIAIPKLSDIGRVVAVGKINLVSGIPRDGIDPAQPSAVSPNPWNQITTLV